MAIRPEFRWVFLSLGVLGVLLAVSALALDKPDVAWRQAAPHCPQCGSPVERYSRRCKVCRDEYEWTVAADEDSPISEWSLSALEHQALRDHVKTLGREEAEARVAADTGLSKAAAKEYLDQVGVGRCGWCGGTGKDLSATTAPPEACPACQGRGRCVACDGDRRIRIGDSGAARDLLRYEAAVADVADVDRRVTIEAQRAEVRRLTEAFLSRWHGTEEATRAWFWPEWKPSDDPPRTVKRSRERLDQVLDALGGTR